MKNATVFQFHLQHYKRMHYTDIMRNGRPSSLQMDSLAMCKDHKISAFQMSWHTFPDCFCTFFLHEPQNICIVNTWRNSAPAICNIFTGKCYKNCSTDSVCRLGRMAIKFYALLDINYFNIKFASGFRSFPPLKANRNANRSIKCHGFLQDDFYCVQNAISPWTSFPKTTNRK